MNAEYKESGNRSELSRWRLGRFFRHAEKVFHPGPTVKDYVLFDDNSERNPIPLPVQPNADTSTLIRLPSSFSGYTTTAPDASDKYTNNLDQCVGLVVSGESASSGDQTSALYHIQPLLIIEPDWLRALHKNLTRFSDSITDTTRTALIAGGLSIPGRNSNCPDSYKQIYRKLVKIVNDATEDTLGVTSYIHPPKTRETLTQIYYETENQNLHVVETDSLIIHDKFLHPEPFVVFEKK